MAISTITHFGGFHPDYFKHRYHPIEVIETVTDPRTWSTRIAYRTKDGKTQVSPPFDDQRALDKFMEAILALEQ